MGRIPEYKRDGVRPTIAVGAGRAEADVSRASQQMFKAAEGIAHQQADLNFRREQIRDESFLTNKAIELENRGTEIFEAHQKKYAKDPLNKGAELATELDKVKAEFQNEAPSGFAKNKLDEVTKRYFSRVSQRAGDWENQQLVKNTATSAAEGLEQLQIKAFRNPNPQSLAILQQEAETVLAPLGKTVRPELADEARKRFMNNSTLSMFEGMIEKNQLGKAESLLKSKEYDEHIGVDGLRKVTKTIQQKRKFNQAKAINLENMKLKKPWQYLAKIGEKVPQLDLKGMDPDSFMKRTMWHDKMSKKHGVKLRFLAPNEEEFFLNELPKQPPQKQIQLVAALGSIPKDEYVKIANQIHDKNPSYGAVFGLMREGSTQSAEDARMIITGKNLASKNKETKKKGIFSPSDAGVAKEFDAYVSHSIRNPRIRESVREAALNHYTAKMFNKGPLPEELDAEEYKMSVQAIVGEPVQINDSSILPFRNDEGKFVEADEMEDLIEGLTDEKIMKAQGQMPLDENGEPARIEKFGDRTHLQTVGEGKYILFMKKEGTYRKALDKNGNDFVLDLKKVSKVKEKKGTSFNNVLSSKSGFGGKL